MTAFAFSPKGVVYFLVEETPDYRKIQLVTDDKVIADAYLSAKPEWCKIYEVDLDAVFELLLLRIVREVAN